MSTNLHDKDFEMVIRLLVADQTRIHTQLLADALRRDGALEVISSDSDELLERADVQNIDVLLLSSDLNDQASLGFDVLRKVRASHPDIRAVMFLNSSKPESVTEAFRSGARGVITRQDSIETLIKCLRRVHQGQVWANSQQMSLVIEALRGSHSPLAISAQSLEHLSKREIEVIGCVAQGLTNNQIAGNLGISEHTVKNYLFRIYDKLGVSNRVELLFTIANRTSALESPAASVEKVGAGQNLGTPSVFAGYQRAAEQGVPTAQLELAKHYFTRRSDPKDLMHAYKWYLIASHQISQMSKNVVKGMSTEQMLQAEKMAAEWPKKTWKMPAASVRAATRDSCMNASGQ